MSKRYEFIDHTADVGVKAYGDTLSDAFEMAATAMFDIITDSSTIGEVGEYTIQLSADSLEELLIDFLSELLFLHDAYGLLFGSFRIEIDEEKRVLNASIAGELFNDHKHKKGNEIKAVTYHLLEVHNTNPYYVLVLFDL